MVHFYHEISDHELYEICFSRIGDVERLAGVLNHWIMEHPELIDDTL